MISRQRLMFRQKNLTHCVYFFAGDNFDLTDSEWDIHVLTGVLKLFFRELMEPLIPFRFLDRFINAMRMLIILFKFHLRFPCICFLWYNFFSCKLYWFNEVFLPCSCRSIYSYARSLPFFAEIADKSEKVKKFRDEIRLLPDPNRDTLKFFTGHLVEYVFVIK